MLRKIVFAVLIGNAVIAGAATGAAQQEMTFTTWGGSYTQAQMKTIVTPFSAATGVKVNVAEYQGGIEQLRRQQASGRVEWDVVDLTMGDALAACKEGLLEKTDPATLEPGVRGETPKQGARNDKLMGVP